VQHLIQTTSLLLLLLLHQSGMHTHLTCLTLDRCLPPAATLAVADAHACELFHSFCFTNLSQGSPMCVSNEHYQPSLLMCSTHYKHHSLLLLLHQADIYDLLTRTCLTFKQCFPQLWACMSLHT
jgi:hypothetical protein